MKMLLLNNLPLCPPCPQFSNQIYKPRTPQTLTRYGWVRCVRCVLCIFNFILKERREKVKRTLFLYKRIIQKRRTPLTPRTRPLSMRVSGVRHLFKSWTRHSSGGHGSIFRGYSNLLAGFMTSSALLTFNGVPLVHSGGGASPRHLVRTGMAW